MYGFPTDCLKLVGCTLDGAPLQFVGGAASDRIVRGDVRCSSCGALYHIEDGILDLLGSDAPVDEDNRKELSLRDGADQLLRGAPGAKLGWRDIAEVESTLRWIGDVSGKVVLELGCGPGVYTRRLLSASRIIAVDFSLAALKRNGSQLPETAPVALVRADVGRLKLAPMAFDVAITTLYSNLPSRALRVTTNRTVAAALRRGGRYIVSTHHQDQRRVLKGLPQSGYYSDGGIYYMCFTPELLRSELDGFEIDAIGPVCVELPLVSRFGGESLCAWVAQKAEKIPLVNRFGSILLGSVRAREGTA